MFYGHFLTKLIQLRHNIVQLQKRSLAYCKPLETASLGGLPTKYGNLLELQMPPAKTATIAAVSKSSYKLRWMSLDQRDSVRAAFLQSVSIIASTGSNSASSLGYTPKVSDSDVYGYNESVSEASQIRMMKSEVSACIP